MKLLQQRKFYHISPPQTSPRKLVGQKSEGEGQKILNENQGFVADFSQFSPKSELPENPPLETVTPQTQQFTGVCGAFHIYRKPSPSKFLVLSSCILCCTKLQAVHLSFLFYRTRRGRRRRPKGRDRSKNQNS